MKLYYRMLTGEELERARAGTPLSFKDKLTGYEITAARQNNQSARVWAISNDQVLVSQQVNLDMSPPGFEWYWTPEWPPETEEFNE